MTMHLYTDGASRGNPGESGIGIVLTTEDGLEHEKYSAYIGQSTNNVAEYMALLVGLQKALNYPCKELVIHSDSELLVRQLLGQYKVRSKHLQQLYNRVKELMKSAPFKITVRHIPREENKAADALANKGIDEKKNILRNLSPAIIINKES